MLLDNRLKIMTQDNALSSNTYWIMHNRLKTNHVTGLKLGTLVF